MRLFAFDRHYVQRLCQCNAEIQQHFAEYFNQLLNIKLRARLRSAGAREDVRQETLARVLAHLRAQGGIEHPECLGAFVNSVCNHVLLEHFRSDKVLSEAAELPDHAAPVADAESAVIAQEEYARVRQLLEEMPVKDRELLRALFFEDLDRDEICRCWNVDRDYLRVLLFRARSKFRAGLAKAAAVVVSII